jgi:hypothetical protein
MIGRALIPWLADDVITAKRRKSTGLYPETS